MTLAEGVVVDIEAAEHVGGYRVRLVFSHDQERIVDFEPFLRTSPNPMIRRYLDPDNFNVFRVEYGDLVWNDYDLCFSIADLYEGLV